MAEGTAPADLGSPVGPLSLAQLAERIAHEREMRLASEIAVEKARQIQFDEYERRLNTLNHAHEAAVEAQRATVPRETFEAYQRESKTALDVALKNLTDNNDRRVLEVDRRLGLLEDYARDTAGQRAGSASTVRWAIAAVGVVGSVLGIVVLVIALGGRP